MWQRLSRISALSFTTAPGARSRTGWSGAGHADVVCEAGEGCLRFFEHGLFTPAGNARALTFRNIYRWQPGDNALSLSHERFGRDRPVWLFDLVAAGPDRLASAKPHVCGRDLYHGELLLNDSGFTLAWTISGPAKDEHLVYQYRCKAQQPRRDAP